MLVDVVDVDEDGGNFDGTCAPMSNDVLRCPGRMELDDESLIPSPD